MSNRQNPLPPPRANTTCAFIIPTPTSDSISCIGAARITYQKRWLSSTTISATIVLEVRHFDPRLFDLLHDLTASLNDPRGEIDVVCGYRTPLSNEFLRTRSAHTGVARHSLHMQAEAIDIRLPGISTAAVRDAAVRLHRGGVGYYRNSNFVHVDVGRVRRW